MRGQTVGCSAGTGGELGKDPGCWKNALAEGEKQKRTNREHILNLIERIAHNGEKEIDN